MLNKENYFSKENNLKYMSYSQVKNFLNCEYGALQKLLKEDFKPTKAMLIGSYVDAYFEGDIEAFKENHKEIFTAKGELKAEYRHANYIIERIKKDSLFMHYLSGEKQVIKTGKIEGVPFKIKMDSYKENEYITDLKVMKDFKNIYDSEEREYKNCMIYWGYHLQGAIYREIEGNNLPFYIASATKENEPDIAVFELTRDLLDEALYIVKENVKRFKAIKDGKKAPKKCGKCDYCKKDKVLKNVIIINNLKSIV